MKRVFCVLLAVTLCVAFTGVHAQIEQSEQQEQTGQPGGTVSPVKIRVMLEVVGDVPINEGVEKYLKTLLGSVEDIEMVEEEPRVYVHVIVREIRASKSGVMGYAMAFASSEIMDMTLEGGIPFVVGDYNGLWMELGPDLIDLSLQCVRAIDQVILDKMRERNAAIYSTMKEEL